MNFKLGDNLKSYEKNLENTLLYQEKILEGLQDLDFEYLTEVSSVYSSNIEGNTLDVNSFMNAKLQVETQTKNREIQEVENLKSAYTFAQKNNLTQENFLKIHAIASENLLIKSKRGIYRNEPVGVFGSEGLIYLAVEAEYIQKNMDELFDEITELLKLNLNFNEVLYYASMIHLRFVHIHPFSDGNGRVARILEKWFLTQKLGREFWKIQSEKYYWEHREVYYANINLGVNFYELNYSESLPFLFMLPESLEV